MKRKLWLIPALITGLCMVLSFIAGHYVRWTPLGTPPEPAVEIASANGRAVYVHAADNKAYRCVHWPRFGSPLSQDCEWEEIDLADFGPGVPEKDETCAYFLPPGRVADRFYFCSGPHWRYVVLTDGSVWAFYSDGDVTFSSYIFMDALWPTCGPSIGLLLGVAIFGLLRWRSHRVT